MDFDGIPFVGCWNNLRNDLKLRSSNAIIYSLKSVIIEPNDDEKTALGRHQFVEKYVLQNNLFGLE